MYNKNTLIEQSKILRKDIIDLIFYAKAGHPGGSLSCIDILNYLYTYEIDLNKDKRSRLVLSKGHVTPALYSIFLEKGVIPREYITTFRRVNSKLQGHPDKKKISQIDANTGLLGQGLSISVGMALAKKLNKDDNYVYCIIGDGEMHEGQIWEALMSASHYKLDNLIAILDYNKLSSKGDVNKVMNLEPIYDKIKAFGFNVLNINGHNFDEINEAILTAKKKISKPTFIIANTTKGKGVSFMENNPKWHSGAITEEQREIAYRYIERGIQ